MSDYQTNALGGRPHERCSERETLPRGIYCARLAARDLPTG